MVVSLHPAVTLGHGDIAILVTQCPAKWNRKRLLVSLCNVQSSELLKHVIHQSPANLFNQPSSQPLPCVQLPIHHCHVFSYLFTTAMCSVTYSPLPCVQLPIHHCHVFSYLFTTAMCSVTYSPLPCVQLPIHHCHVFSYLFTTAMCSVTYSPLPHTQPEPVSF